MDASALPCTTKQWEHTKKWNGKPALALSIRRPAFPDSGKTTRLERYFARIGEYWQSRWETVLFPEACKALAEATEGGTDFLPWQAQLDYTITLWQPPLLSLRMDAVESGPTSRPLRICMGETWDCSSGYPRTLRSFFPAKARRWQKDLLGSLKEQAAQQLASGESLLDPDCTQIMERTFDPDRFYLTENGIAVFYPLYILGPYAEGIPVFTVPFSETTLS